MTMRALLLEVYNAQGPREGGFQAAVPPEKFAKLTPQEVDTRWDFDERHLMHRIAQALAVGEDVRETKE